MHLMFVLYLYSLYLYHNKKQKSSIFVNFNNIFSFLFHIRTIQFP